MEDKRAHCAAKTAVFLDENPLGKATLDSGLFARTALVKDMARMGRHAVDMKRGLHVILGPGFCASVIDDRDAPVEDLVRISQRAPAWAHTGGVLVVEARRAYRSL